MKIHLILLRGSLDLGYSDIDDFVETKENGEINEGLDYNLGNHMNELYDSNLDESGSYLDKPYIKKIYDKCEEENITLERRMLFANIDACMEVLRDYAT